MVEPTGEVWREIICGYLLALHDDARANREFSLKNSQGEFLREYGTPTVHGDYTRAARAFLESLVQLSEAPGWRMVEEGENRVLVEMIFGPSHFTGHRVPFMSTRLLLVKRQGSWKISDVFEPCIGCSIISGNAGQCHFCRGNGEQLGITGSRFWWFKGQ